MKKESVSNAADVKRRVLEILIAIAPDAPLPLELIKTVISGDNLLHGPTDSIFINLRQSDSIATQAMRRLFPELTQWDVQHDIVTISTEGQQQAHRLLASLPMTPAMRRRKRDRVSLMIFPERCS